jgi:hypothetical protein
MGSNKTFQQKHGEHVVLGESSEFRRLRHAVEKADGDRERAIRNVCRLYGIKTLDALPRCDSGGHLGAPWSARLSPVLI